MIIFQCHQSSFVKNLRIFAKKVRQTTKHLEENFATIITLLGIQKVNKSIPPQIGLPVGLERHANHLYEDRMSKNMIKL